MIELNSIERQAALILLKSVNRFMPYYYSDLASMLDPPVNPHTELPHIIGNVSILCSELGLPLLSAKVINKGTKKVGDGFYKIFILHSNDSLVLKDKNPEEVWKEEIEKIRMCDNWEPLKDYLGVEIDIPISPKRIKLEQANSINTVNMVKSSLRTKESVQQIYPDEVNNFKTRLKDGAIKEVTVNQYERNPEARQQCIAYYGTTCFICGFNFGDTYGPEFTGKIHVHHLKPLSEIKGEYEINPVKDLRPVCPNCHMILHSKKDGVYTVDEVKAKLKNCRVL